jgi:hypothetical protein
MKAIFATGLVLLVVNQWDQNYNHGTLTRTGFSLAKQLAQAFRI